MTPDLQGYYFRPMQNVEDLLPHLYTILLVLGILVILWLAINGILRWQARNLAWKRFQAIARRFSLTRQEIFLLQKLAGSSKLSAPAHLLTNEEQFETIVKTVETNGRRIERRLIASARRKIFGGKRQSASSMHSTEDLPTGTKLLIQRVNDPEAVVWGHLVDNDKQGLIVIVPSHQEIRTPLHVESQLEATAFLSEQEPLIFMTWVQSIIPGPRKMLVLGHSEFLVDKKGLSQGEARLIGPQFQTKEDRPIFRSQKASNQHPSCHMTYV